MNNAADNIKEVKVKSKDPKEELKSIIHQKISEAKSSFKAPGIFHIITQTIDIVKSKIIERSLEGADIVIVPFGLKVSMTLILIKQKS